MPYEERVRESMQHLIHAIKSYLFLKNDNKFFDLINTWYRFSNEPLKRSLERFAKFPIPLPKKRISQSSSSIILYLDRR
jgi:hypothetical protein